MNTSIDLVKIDGLDLPGISLGDVNRPQEHGDFIGGMFLRGRRVILELEAKAVDAAGLEVLWNQMEDAFTPKADPFDQVEEALTYQLPGQALRRIYCRPVRRSLTIDGDWQLGVFHSFVELKASDPRIYDDALQTASTSLATLAGGGLTFGATVPFTFGGAISGGQMTCTNTGKFPVPVIFTISGGTVTNPKIEHIESAKYLDMSQGGSVSVATTDIVTIDTKFKAIILNGTASRGLWLKRPISQWFSLLPGTNTIKFSGTTTGTATLTATWRSGRT